MVISIAASRQKDVASTKSDDTTSFWFVKQQAYGPGRLSFCAASKRGSVKDFAQIGLQALE
ncbi:hypothetical protein [Lawsonibacter hominis]|uniref:hypothetical protein n=1 Tax=Lawsonibacter hominis TaxID=2763053 RepID=UPI001A9BCF5E|nr:hypothetical protein [Lawsonibacter hominis]